MQEGYCLLLYGNGPVGVGSGAVQWFLVAAEYANARSEHLKQPGAVPRVRTG